MGGWDERCSRGIRLLNGSKLLLVEALLFDNILLLLPLLLLPLQRPIVVFLPLSSSCIDEWCSMESSMEKLTTFSPSLRTPTSRADHKTVHRGHGATMGGWDEWCSVESSMERLRSAVAAVLHTGCLPGGHGCAVLHTRGLLGHVLRAC